MSLSGITSLFNLPSQAIQSQHQRFRQEFQQLGQDLAAGKLASAQSDFANLQQLLPSSSSSTASLGQQVDQLSSDLKSGDLKDAQQLYSQLAKELRAHHMHHGGGSTLVQQDFSQLQQALQAGNLSAAQQAYTCLQDSIDHFGLNNALFDTASSSTNSLSLQA